MRKMDGQNLKRGGKGGTTDSNLFLEIKLEFLNEIRILWSTTLTLTASMHTDFPHQISGDITEWDF